MNERPTVSAVPIEVDQSLVLEWLRGEALPEVKGERIVLYTYNDQAYLAVDDGKYAPPRYQFENGQLVLAPLRRPIEEPEVIARTQSIYRAIRLLAADGTLVQRRVPLAHEGAYVAYGLPQ